MGDDPTATAARCVPLCAAGDEASWWQHEALCPARANGRPAPLRVNGKPIPKHIIDGPPGEFARFCGETDPAVLALLDAEADDAD
jgi:hypothetical protein